MALCHSIERLQLKFLQLKTIMRRPSTCWLECAEFQSGLSCFWSSAHWNGFGKSHYSPLPARQWPGLKSSLFLFLFWSSMFAKRQVSSSYSEESLNARQSRSHWYLSYDRNYRCTFFGDSANRLLLNVLCLSCQFCTHLSHFFSYRYLFIWAQAFAFLTKVWLLDCRDYCNLN